MTLGVGTTVAFFQADRTLPVRMLLLSRNVNSCNIVFIASFNNLLLIPLIPLDLYILMFLISLYNCEEDISFSVRLVSKLVVRSKGSSGSGRASPNFSANLGPIEAK